MASLRGAINAKCKDCIYDPLLPGTWRKQVQECTCDDCPLHPVRPIASYAETGPKQGQNEAEARQ